MVIYIIKKFLGKRPFTDGNQYSTENQLQASAAGSQPAFSKAAGVEVTAVPKEQHQIKVRNGEILKVLCLRKKQTNLYLLRPYYMPVSVLYIWEQKEPDPKELDIINLET